MNSKLAPVSDDVDIYIASGRVEFERSSNYAREQIEESQCRTTTESECRYVKLIIKKHLEFAATDLFGIFRKKYGDERHILTVPISPCFIYF